MAAEDWERDDQQVRAHRCEYREWVGRNAAKAPCGQQATWFTDDLCDATMWLCDDCCLQLGELDIASTAIVP